MCWTMYHAVKGSARELLPQLTLSTVLMLRAAFTWVSARNRMKTTITLTMHDAPTRSQDSQSMTSHGSSTVDTEVQTEAPSNRLECKPYLAGPNT